MTDFFNYLKEILVAFFDNLGKWFYDRWAYPWTRVPAEFTQYNSIFRAYSNGFGGGGWVMFVIFTILFVGLIGALLFLLFWLCFLGDCKRGLDLWGSPLWRKQL